MLSQRVCGQTYRPARWRGSTQQARRLTAAPHSFEAPRGPLRACRTLDGVIDGDMPGASSVVLLTDPGLLVELDLRRRSDAPVDVEPHDHTGQVEEQRS